MNGECGQPEVLEAALRDAHAAGAYQRALTLLVEGYGPELLGFVAVLLRDEEDAREVFAQACEAMVRGLPGFEGRSSFRTWSYAVARNAAFNFRRRRVPLRLDTTRELRLVREPRVSTQPHLKTENKALLARLRAELDPASQALLTLRLDRGMTWLQVAEVLAERPLAPDERARAAARCRKRFDRIKERLRDAARRCSPAPSPSR
ncbi:MAG: sigma-70 family RNA polymerase sigma factor [Myxococcota bacterium]